MRAIVGASASHDDCSFVAELSWVYMTIAHSLPSFRGFQSLEFAGRVVGGKISTIPGMYVLYLAAVEISFLDWIFGGLARSHAGQLCCIIIRTILVRTIFCQAQLPGPTTPTSDSGSRVC